MSACRECHLVLTVISREQAEGASGPPEDGGIEGRVCDADALDALSYSIVQEWKQDSQLSSLETTLDLLREARNSQSTNKDGIPYRESTKNFALVLVVKYVWTGHDAALNGAVKVITDALESGTDCHESDVAEERRTEVSTSIQPSCFSHSCD